jgi:hypothetical protein
LSSNLQPLENEAEVLRAIKWIQNNFEHGLHHSNKMERKDEISNGKEDSKQSV